jgi:hypothetical protein
MLGRRKNPFAPSIKTLSSNVSLYPPSREFNKATGDEAGLGTHRTGSVRKAHALELGRFSTRNSFHSEVLRRNEVFVLTTFIE